MLTKWPSLLKRPYCRPRWLDLIWSVALKCSHYALNSTSEWQLCGCKTRNTHDVRELLGRADTKKENKGWISTKKCVHKEGTAEKLHDVCPCDVTNIPLSVTWWFQLSEMGISRNRTNRLHYNVTSITVNHLSNTHCTVAWLCADNATGEIQILRKGIFFIIIFEKRY